MCGSVWKCAPREKVDDDFACGIGHCANIDTCVADECVEVCWDVV